MAAHIRAAGLRGARRSSSRVVYRRGRATGSPITRRYARDAAARASRLCGRSLLPTPRPTARRSLSLRAALFGLAFESQASSAARLRPAARSASAGPLCADLDHGGGRRERRTRHRTRSDRLQRATTRARIVSALGPATAFAGVVWAIRPAVPDHAAASAWPGLLVALRRAAAARDRRQACSSTSSSCQDCWRTSEEGHATAS